MGCWNVSKDGVLSGPYSDDDIIDFLERGHLSGEDFVVEVVAWKQIKSTSFGLRDARLQASSDDARRKSGPQIESLKIEVERRRLLEEAVLDDAKRKSVVQINVPKIEVEPRVPQRDYSVKSNKTKIVLVIVFMVVALNFVNHIRKSSLFSNRSASQDQLIAPRANALPAPSFDKNPANKQPLSMEDRGTARLASLTKGLKPIDEIVAIVNSSVDTKSHPYSAIGDCGVYNKNTSSNGWYFKSISYPYRYERKEIVELAKDDLAYTQLGHRYDLIFRSNVKNMTHSYMFSPMGGGYDGTGSVIQNSETSQAGFAFSSRKEAERVAELVAKIRITCALGKENAFPSATFPR